MGSIHFTSVQGVNFIKTSQHGHSVLCHNYSSYIKSVSTITLSEIAAISLLCEVPFSMCILKWSKFKVTWSQSLTIILPLQVEATIFGPGHPEMSLSQSRHCHFHCSHCVQRTAADIIMRERTTKLTSFWEVWLAAGFHSNGGPN